MAEPWVAFGNEDFEWLPLVNVRLGRGRTKPSYSIEALVDTGSPLCLFRADLGRLIGFDVEAGPGQEIGGVTTSEREPAYFHTVKLYIAGNWTVRVTVGFVETLHWAGILGRRGFFDRFAVRFDHSVSPPVFDLERIPQIQ
jgi:hypothetical protein